MRALAEDKADIQLDPVLYRACAVDLKGACKDVPRGNGRRKSVADVYGTSKAAHHLISSPRICVT